MSVAVLVISVALGTAAGPPAATAKPKLLVTAITPAGGVDAAVAGALTEAITNQVARGGYFEPLSAKEIATITGQERTRQLMGCKEDSTTCLTELAGAMGARFVLSGTLAKLGAAYQLTLQTLDTTKAQPVGRVTRIANELETLTAGLPWSVAEATATPLPEPPSRVLPYSLLTAGGVVFLGGALATFDSITREVTLADELRGDPSQLRPLAEYQGLSQQISLERGIGIGALAVGAGLAGLGLLVMPKGTAGGVALVPTGRGVALVGVLP